ncbi:hypothetical protein MPTK1_6g01380 [Marchantia polymorpha subsp. ruderalis]|uniref:Uncharacterized protein n=2 Tax=Marchantia polymorpha TaxID=3197 RepID=A0AAF6BMD3_MARPO|nr:hypothetical protein MARPO_0052s0066 [Marchantia polymorpha]BBN13167.1 hypothetical protein Mp_6g01380 [Marchantia polymorpha subsp. ruderalis]|eukprot:PTQ38280.1 hypothetical protein MARPO_0052s0066 [Marchantia polymorpha]
MRHGTVGVRYYCPYDCRRNDHAFDEKFYQFGNSGIIGMEFDFQIHINTLDMVRQKDKSNFLSVLIVTA